VVAICVIVVGIAVPIWLLLAQDLSTQSATTTPLNETWRWSIPVLLALAAFLGFLFGIRERSHGEIVKASLPNGLYVGQIHASFSRFEDDYCIELAVRFYNGTSDIITVGQLRGAIRYGESIDGKRIERELLPAPAFLTDRTNVSNIQSLTETMVVLEQRVPRNIALRMNEVFAAGYIITFDLRTLEIPVSIAGKTDTSTPLPTHSLTFKKEADAIVTNRIAYAVGHATARAATIVQ
jgi:hypothetical protein